MSDTPSSVIIAGAGIIGMLSAYLMAENGLEITLIEQNYAGKESSWAGGGILSPLYPWRYPDAVTALAKWGQSRYPALLADIHQQSGIDPEHQVSGLLYLDIEDELTTAQQWMDTFTYPFEMLNAAKLHHLSHALHPNYAQGWFTHDIGQVRNPRLVRALQQLMRQHPAITLLENTRVDHLILEGTQIRGVKASQKSFMADKVVIAGGAWSAQLLSQVQQLPKIAPVKGQMIVYKAPVGLIQQIILSKGRYLIPRRDGRIVLGSTLEFNDFDKSTDAQTLHELKAEAERIVPALTAYEVEKQWAGLRPGSIDGIPYTGPHPSIQNLYINAGHFRNGVVIGYASCELLKNLILNETPIVNPEPYQLHAQRLVTTESEINLQGAI